MEKEPTLLDYARFHGLAVPFDSINSFSDFLALNPPQLDLTDPPGCQDINALASALSKDLLREKLVVSHDVAQRIARIIKPPELPPWPALDQYRRIKSLRIEPPLLPTDHDLDVKQFQGEVKRPDIDLSDLRPIPTDEDKDEGLTFPRRYLEVADRLNKQLAKEKLDTTREVLSTIRRLIEHRFDPEVERCAIKEDLHYSRSRTRDPLTPLLVPLDEEKELFVPSSPALELELLSDKTDPLIPSRKQLDVEISRGDQITIDDCGDADAKKVKDLIEIAQQGPKLPEPIPALSKEVDRSATERPTRELKLEPPLLPLEHTPSPTFRGDDFAGFLEQAVPFCLLDNLKVNKSEDLLSDEELGRLAGEALEKVNAAIANEQIDNIEVIGRVSVPILDRVDIRPPWKSDSGMACLNDITELRSDVMNRQWQAGDDLDRRLRWAPFTKRPPEVYDDDDSISGSEELISTLLKPPKDPIESKDILRKPKKLQILSNAVDSEEEKLAEDADLAAELRAVGLKARRLSKHCSPGLAENIQNRIKEPYPLKRHARQLSAGNGDEANTADLGMLQSAQSSTAKALSTFLQTRSRKYRRLDSNSSPFFAKHPPETPQKESSTLAEVQVPATPMPITKATATPSPAAYSSPPRISLSATRTLIVDIALLNMYSSLINRLETVSPHPPHLIFREFKADPLFPSTNRSTPDIILSPTSAIMIVPLQSIVQRGLPGQGTAKPALQSRIISLATQFDRLFVLATCKISEENHIDTAATSSLATLTALCASLGPVAQASVIVVPPMTSASLETDRLALMRGEKPTLNHHLLNWILALVERDGFSTKGLVLLTEETVWEAFLKRAGLNPFAAQVLLGMLKRPKQHQARTKPRWRIECGGELWGIRRLIQMTQEERESHFEEVVGKRAVERLGSMLDSGWEQFGRGLRMDEDMRAEFVDNGR